MDRKVLKESCLCIKGTLRGQSAILEQKHLGNDGYLTDYLIY